MLSYRTLSNQSQPKKVGNSYDVSLDGKWVGMVYRIPSGEWMACFKYRHFSKPEDDLTSKDKAGAWIEAKHAELTSKAD